MSRPDHLLSLPVTSHLQSPISISHSVVKHFNFSFLRHKWRLLPQVTAQALLQFRLLLLLWMSSLMAPLLPPHLLLLHQRNSVVRLFRQGLYTTNTAPRHHFSEAPLQFVSPQMSVFKPMSSGTNFLSIFLTAGISHRTRFSKALSATH